MDAVIHVAGVVNAPDAEGFEAGNVAGTRAMVEAAQAAGVQRFVHTSSLTAREPDLSNYGASKVRAEAIVEASGLDWTIIRPPAVYGPNDTDMLDLFRMAKWGFVLLPPHGRLSLIEVSDLAKLLLAVVPARESISAVYEADDGAPDGWTHKGMGRAIGWAVDREILPLPLPKFVLVAAATADRLFRRSGAKLTRDRVNYMCHPDWTIDPARRPPQSVWEPHMNTRTGLKLAARAYRIKGWL